MPANDGREGQDNRPQSRNMMDKAAFQVIVLGPTGGPREDNVTGLLVRSTSTEWSKGSVVAVDAGTLLAGIIRTLEQHIISTKDGKALMKDGPFVGLDLPHATAQANAAYIFREIIGAVLITHPHLDHLSGLAINTPMLEAGNGPKTLAALPSVISAIKNHMFNDIIWPNLSDEDGGAGLVTYQRLVEGGNPRFGRGESRGYVRACEGLVTKCVSISHGRCKQRYNPETGRHHRVGSAVFTTDPLMVPSRTFSVDHSDGGIFSPYTPHPLGSLSSTGGKDSAWATVESSAFFIRDGLTGSEIIVFGDIEPDSVSLEPRNKRVWEIAAPKVASGSLRAIFIECSYNDSVDDSSLYGHLCPRHLIAELKVLAAKVVDAQQADGRRRSNNKRKRNDSDSADGGGSEQVSPRSKRPVPHVPANSCIGDDCIQALMSAQSTQPRYNNSSDVNARESQPHERTPSITEFINTGDANTRTNARWTSEDSSDSTTTRPPPPSPPPLAGLSVYIIHIKDTLTDGPHPGEQILQELRAQSEEAGLGCEFFVPKQGEGIWI